MIGQGRSLARALVALPSTGLGGTERHTAALADALAAAGVAVTVALEPALQAGFAAMLGGRTGENRPRPEGVGKFPSGARWRPPYCTWSPVAFRVSMPA